MPGLQTRRVDSRELRPLFEQLALATQRQNAREHLVRRRLAEQAVAGRTERGEVRHALQAEDLSQVGPFGQPHLHAAIVEAKELLDDQTCEQLRLSELAWAFAVGVVRQRIACRPQCEACHRERTLAGHHKTLRKSLTHNAQENN